MRPGFGAGVAAAALASVIWGAQFPVAKGAYVALDPVQLNAARYLMSVALIVAILALREGPRALSYEGRFTRIGLYGFIGMCCSPLLVFGGLAFTRPEHVAIIVATQPSLTALAQWWVRGVRPARFTLACLTIAFAGALLVITRGGLVAPGTLRELGGDAMVLGGSMCWVAYTMLTEHRSGWSNLRYTTLLMIGGAIGNTSVALVAVGAGWITIAAPAAWGSVLAEVLYLGLCGIFVAMTLWNYGTQRIGSLNALLLTNLVPVVTFVVRYAQGYRFTAAELAGAAMVVGALVANNLYQRRRAPGAG